MPTESQYPDVLLLQSNLSGAVTDIDDDPDSPDGLWLTAVDNNTDSVCRVSFPTPTGNLNTGVGLQQFRAWVRITANATATSWVIDLYENGSLVTASIASGSATSTTGELITANWDAASLAAVDGSNVEFLITFSRTGGSPTNRTTGEVGAIEWVVDYTTAVTRDATATIAGTSTVTSAAPTALRNALGVVTSSSTVTASPTGTFGVSAAIASTSTVTAVAQKVKDATASIIGYSWITADPEKPSGDGKRETENAVDLRITEAGDQRVTENWDEAFASLVASGSIVADGTLTAGGTVHVGVAALTSSGSATVFAGLVQQAQSSFSSVGSISAIGSLKREGVSSLSASGSVAVSASLANGGSASLNATASMTAVGTLTTRGAVNLIASSSITASTIQTIQAFSSMTATGGIVAAPDLAGFIEGFASLASSSTLTADGSLIKPESASLSAVSSLAATASLTKSGAANLTATATINALPRIVIYGDASLSATGLLGDVTVAIKMFGQTLPVQTDLIRETEDAIDIRVTEDGLDTRITGLVEGNLIAGSMTATATHIPFSSTAYIKDDGIWKIITPYAKNSGAWQEPDRMYKKISGVWKRIY